MPVRWSLNSAAITPNRGYSRRRVASGGAVKGGAIHPEFLMKGPYGNPPFRLTRKAVGGKKIRKFYNDAALRGSGFGDVLSTLQQVGSSFMQKAPQVMSNLMTTATNFVQNNPEMINKLMTNLPSMLQAMPAMFNRIKNAFGSNQPIPQTVMTGLSQLQPYMSFMPQTMQNAFQQAQNMMQQYQQYQQQQQYGSQQYMNDPYLAQNQQMMMTYAQPQYMQQYYY